MRVLVTGAAGNIGRALVPKLRERHEVFELDRLPGYRPHYFTADVRDGMDMEDAFSHSRPHCVYHLAAMVSRVTCEPAPQQALAVNVSGARNVAELTGAYEAKLIHVSTSEVYGPRDSLAFEHDTLEPNNWYGHTKAMGEKAIRYACPTATIVRPFMLYSEDEDRGAHRSAMIRFAEAIAKGEPITIHRGTSRSWLHMDDATDFLVKLGEIDEAPDVLNIGHPEQVETEDLAKRLASAFGPKQQIDLFPSDLPPGMTAHKRPDLSRQTALGLVPKVSLEEGVRRVAEAFR